MVLLATGLVLGAQKLRPISWSVWAGGIEERGGGENPWRGMEGRGGFGDVRVSLVFVYIPWGDVGGC